jgi:hypothetical protein
MISYFANVVNCFKLIKVDKGQYASLDWSKIIRFIQNGLKASTPQS